MIKFDVAFQFILLILIFINLKIFKNNPWHLLLMIWDAFRHIIYKQVAFQFLIFYDNLNH